MTIMMTMVIVIIITDDTFPLCVAHWLPLPLSSFFFFFNVSLKNVSFWCEAAGEKGEVNPSLIHGCTAQDQGCDDCVISSQQFGSPSISTRQNSWENVQMEEVRMPGEKYY